MKKVKPTKRPNEPQVTDAKAVGAFVRAARTADGLTIEQAAELIGISKHTLADLEQGKETVGIGIVMRVLSDLGQTLLVSGKEAAGSAAATILEIERDYEGTAGGTAFFR